MTSPREIHRQKKKKSLNFGDFMMPLLGVVLVLLVIFGLKVLFFGGKTGDEVNVPAPVAQSVPAQPVLPQTPQGGEGSQVPVSGAAASSPSVALPELPKLDDLPAVTVDAMEVKPVQDVPTYQAGSVTAEKTATSKAAEKSGVSKSAVVKPAAAKSAVAKTETVKSKKTGAAAPAVKVVPAVPAPKAAAPKTAVPAPAPVVPAVSAGKGFSVQAGSFTSAQSANDVVAKMKSAGMSARVERAEVSGRAFFRVFVSGGSTRDQALAVESKIKSLGKYDTLIVKDK